MITILTNMVYAVYIKRNTTKFSIEKIEEYEDKFNWLKDSVIFSKGLYEIGMYVKEDKIEDAKITLKNIY